jgi:hypothetical protein
MSETDEAQAKADAIRHLKGNYLDVYCSSTGGHRAIANALFDDLIACYDPTMPTPKPRGFSRKGLAKIGGIAPDLSGDELRKKLSGFDKTLRTIAQNFQIFGNPRTKLPPDTKLSGWQLDPAAVARAGGILEAACTYDIGGDPYILAIRGPVAEARGDTDSSRYFFVATFTLTDYAHAFADLLESLRTLAHLEKSVTAMALLTPMLKGFFARTPVTPRQREDMEMCLQQIAAMRELRQTKRAELEADRQKLETFRAGTFLGDLKSLKFTREELAPINALSARLYESFIPDKERSLTLIEGMIEEVEKLFPT